MKMFTKISHDRIKREFIRLKRIDIFFLVYRDISFYDIWKGGGEAVFRCTAVCVRYITLINSLFIRNVIGLWSVSYLP